MLDGYAPAAALAGALCASAVMVIAFGAPRLDVADGAARLPRSLRLLRAISAVWQWLSLSIERAGWDESPERVAALGVALGACFSGACALVSAWLAPLGAAAGVAVVALWLRAAGDRRRTRLGGELVPLLELFTLELSGGGSALAALGSVSLQVEGELAGELRRMLISSQVTGSQSFEARLIEYSELIGLPALATLATILGADREFGTGASQGARALATDLRRTQRRDLITHSRRALNHVLLPAAVGVLLPFLGVLMFPAVSVLQRSLR